MTYRYFRVRYPPQTPRQTPDLLDLQQPQVPAPRAALTQSASASSIVG